MINENAKGKKDIYVYIIIKSLVITFLLPLLFRAQEVTAAAASITSSPSSFSLSNTKEHSKASWFMRRKPVQVNLSTIRSNYKISRKRARYVPIFLSIVCVCMCMI